MQELTKRTEVQNKIRFLNDNNIPYDIYIGEHITSRTGERKKCIIINYYGSNYYYDIDNGYCIDAEWDK